MGGTSSKPKTNPKLTRSNNVTSIIKEPRPSVESFAAKWQGIMAILATHQIPENLSEPIIMFYLLDYVPKIFPGTNHFSISHSKNILFATSSDSFSDTAKLGLNCVNGRPEEVRFILEKNRDPFLLTTPIECVDHRGPGYFSLETAFVHTLCSVGDVLIEDEKEETMVEMQKNYIIEKFGNDEWEIQRGRAFEVYEEQTKKKEDLKPFDKIAANELWKAIDKVVCDLESDPELKIAIDKFEKQLKQPGSEEIITDILLHFKATYFYGWKQDFIVKNILKLTLKMRLSVCDLQYLLAKKAQADFLQANGCQDGYQEGYQNVKKGARTIDVVSALEKADPATIIFCATLVERLYRKKVATIEKYLPKVYMFYGHSRPA